MRLAKFSDIRELRFEFGRELRPIGFVFLEEFVAKGGGRGIESYGDIVGRVGLEKLLYKRNKALMALGDLPEWGQEDVALIALAASFVAKIVELRLTMDAARLDPPIPLDSRDFAYLKVCSDDFSKEASRYLFEASESERALAFHMRQLLATMTAAARKNQVSTPRSRELDGVRFSSRVKAPRSLFSRLC